MAKGSEGKPQLVGSKLLDNNDQIRIRAYALYEERGRASGHELDDWFRAEGEVKSQENRDAAA